MNASSFRSLVPLLLCATVAACSDDAPATSSSPLDGLNCEAGQPVEGTGSPDDPWRCGTAGGGDSLASLDCGDGIPVVGTGDTNDPWRCGSAPSDTDTLAGLSCSNGQHATYDGTNWQCSDAAPTVTAGEGIEVTTDSGTVTVAVDADAVGTAIGMETITGAQLAPGAMPGVLVSPDGSTPGAQVRCDQDGSLTATGTYTWQAGQDGSCINAALAYAIESGIPRVYLGGGTFDLDEEIFMSQSAELIGMGATYTVLTSSATDVDTLIRTGGADVVIRGIRFDLDWDSSSSNIYGVHIGANRGWVIRECQFNLDNLNSALPTGVYMDAAFDTPMRKELSNSVFIATVPAASDCQAVRATPPMNTVQKDVVITRNTFQLTHGIGDVVGASRYDTAGWTVTHNRFIGDGAATLCGRFAIKLLSTAPGNRIAHNRIEHMKSYVYGGDRFENNDMTTTCGAVALNMTGNDMVIDHNRFDGYASMFFGGSLNRNVSISSNVVTGFVDFVGSVNAINLRFLNNQVRGGCTGASSLLTLGSMTDDAQVRFNAYSGETGSNCTDWVDNQSTGTAAVSNNPFFDN